MAKEEDQKAVSSMRHVTLEFLIAQFQDAQRYVSELKRAISSFSGELPEDSPYRYAVKSVGDAVVEALKRRVGKPQAVKDIIRELEAGGCMFGTVKSKEEIVLKAIKANIPGRLRWFGERVGLSEWSRK